MSFTCQFQRVLYQTLCVFSHIKDRKNNEQNFHSVARILPYGGTWGAGESKKTLLWVFAMAPTQLLVLVSLSDQVRLKLRYVATKG